MECRRRIIRVDCFIEVSEHGGASRWTRCPAKHCKFIGTESANDRSLSKRLPQEFRCADQETVADSPPHRVIDELQMLDLERKQERPALARARHVQKLFARADEPFTIVKLRQLVDERR